MKKIITLTFLIFNFAAMAQLSMKENDEMRLVYYDFGHHYILAHAEKSFQNALNFHKKLFDYQPSEKISILIQDFGDFGNGGATAIPKNAISMGLSPFSYTFETSPAGERIYSMMNHELVHVVALDNSSKTDRFYHKLFFGKVMPSKDNPITALYSYLTSPRRYSPRWYHEGIASYVETWMSGGVGLAMGNYDEMVFRTRVLENARIYTAQGLEAEGTTTDFQGKSNSYLYGTRFMGYLSLTYGPEKIIEWTKRKDGSRRLFSAQFKNVFDIPLTESWDNWIAFEKEWQLKNIKNLNKHPVTAVTPITDKALGSVSYPHFDKKRNKVYVAINYPGQVPHLAAIHLENGKLEKLTDIKGAALFYVSSVAYDAEGDQLFFTTDNDAWRDLNSYNLKTGKVERLQKDFRTGDMTVNKSDRSLWGIKHLNGVSTIVRVPETTESDPSPYHTWQQKYTLPYGQDIFDIDLSPDGKKLSAAVTDLKGNQYLLIFDTDEFKDGKAKADTVFNFDISSPQCFRFTEDGKHLFGSSYFSGVSNIFKVNVASFEIYPMSNVLSGLFRPLHISEEKLFAFHFSSDGFLPVYIPNQPVDSISSIDFLGNVTIEKHPILEDWRLPISSSKEIAKDNLDLPKEKYNPGKQFNINSAYPLLVGYKNFMGLGYGFNFSDPFNFRALDFSLSYTPAAWSNGWASENDSTNLVMGADEQFHFSFNVKLGRFNFSGTYNDADFYDLFGPTRTSRKGTTLNVDYTKSLVWDAPKKLDLQFGAAGFYGLQKSPQFQQIITDGFDNNLFVTLNSNLTYSYLKNSLGAVDHEKGLKTSLITSTAISGGQLFPRLIGTLDYGVQLPINHFSIWFRSAFGSSFSNDFNPFTRFGFAAFGNNFLDFQTARRYRTIFSFPGLSFNSDKSIISRDFGKGMMEIVFPPLRFRNLGGMNLYASWVQATLFSSTLYTLDPTTMDNHFVNVGSQVDLKVAMFSLLDTTISFGYATAFDILNSNTRYEEWMISLKLLH